MWHYIKYCAKYRTAFTLAHFNVLPSALLEGRFSKIPVNEWICPYGTGVTEYVEHVILHCNMYEECRKKLISPILTAFSGCSPTTLVLICLRDVSSHITERVSKFLMTSMKIRKKKVAIFLRE